MTNDFKEGQERELDFYCKILVDITKEVHENNTKTIKWLSSRPYREFWTLQKRNEFLASKNAFKEYSDLTGKDIRNCDWESRYKTKEGKTIPVHTTFKFEHMTTAYDFKTELVKAYMENKLTTEFTRNLLSKQKMCWITKTENKILDKKFKKTRIINGKLDPDEAYKQSGIVLEESEIIKDNKIKQAKEKDMNKIKFKPNTRPFFKELYEYFENNVIKGKKYVLTTYNNKEYATIYREKGIWINVRIKKGFSYNEITSLTDVGIYIEAGNKAKENFEKLKSYKETIEKHEPHKLKEIQPITPIPNKNEQSFRISKLYNDSILNFEEDVKRVAEELACFYEIFMPAIKALN